MKDLFTIFLGNFLALLSAITITTASVIFIAHLVDTARTYFRDKKYAEAMNKAKKK